MIYFLNSITKIRDICNEMHLLTTADKITSIINNAIVQQLLYMEIEKGLQSCSYIDKFATDLKFVIKRENEDYEGSCIDTKNIDYLIDNISMCKHHLNKIRETLDNNDITDAINYMKNLDLDADRIKQNTKSICDDLRIDTEGVF